MSDASRAPGAAQPVQPVEVYSCPKPPAIACVRFLGPVSGLLTHYTSRGSVPCGLPDYCEPKQHRSRLIWKGYASVLRWRGGANQDWIRAVLEITEALGEQLEGHELRGQEWEISRVKDDRGYEVVQGTCTQSLSPGAMPQADRLEPILLRFYRVSSLTLGKENPLPRRALAEPISGSPPRRLADRTPLPAPQNASAPRPKISARLAQPAAPQALGEILGRVLSDAEQPATPSNGNGQHKPPQR